jgi:hypothetical protein
MGAEPATLLTTTVFTAFRYKSTLIFPLLSVS